MMMIMMIMSMLLIFFKHPLSMGFTLLMQTILISLILGYFNSNYWFSYILFLILIGGMLVLFIYMTSIASNEKFKFSMKLMIFSTTLILLFMVTMILIDSYFINLINFNIENTNNFNQFYLSLNQYLNYPKNMILFLLIIYLLITLIAVIKITNIKKGPLRQKN